MDIIEMARDLGKAIQADERYIAMAMAQEKNDNDADLQDKIGKFNLKRMELNQLVQKSDRNPDDVKALDAQVKALYQEIFENPNMAAFSTARTEIEAVMNKINAILSGSVNGQDPDLIDVDGEGCSGGCSSCSGCH